MFLLVLWYFVVSTVLLWCFVIVPVVVVPVVMVDDGDNCDRDSGCCCYTANRGYLIDVNYLFLTSHCGSGSERVEHIEASGVGFIVTIFTLLSASRWDNFSYFATNIVVIRFCHSVQL